MNTKNIDNKSLDAMVDEYLSGLYHDLEREIHFYKSRPSLTETINRVAMGEMSSGKRSSHQYRFSQMELEEAKRYLLEMEEKIHACETFDELHGLASKAIRHVYKNAVLYVYDTAWRIGANLNIEPGLVYVHAGTRRGAEALGFNPNQKTIDLEKFPPPLQRLRPIHIENFLCLYKDRPWNPQDDKQPIRGC